MLPGIGRDMHVGDTIIGIKGRVGFEAAAPMLIIGAHRFLEKYTLSKWQQYWKDQVANWYGMFLHESQYLEPVMRDIEAMLQESQRNVNGTAILELRPLSFSTVGVESADDLVKTKQMIWLKPNLVNTEKCKKVGQQKMPKDLSKFFLLLYVFIIQTTKRRKYD